VQGHNSPLPKTLLTKIPTLTAIWSSQHEGEEDVASSDKRERTNMSKLMVEWTVVVEDECVRLMVVGEKWRKRGERMKMREKVQLKNQLSPALYWKLLKFP